MLEKVKIASAMFPENRIDILVNSAGIINHSDFLDMSKSEYDDVLDINAKGTFFMFQAIAKYMIENQSKGHILNVTSSSALRLNITIVFMEESTGEFKRFPENNLHYFEQRSDTGLELDLLQKYLFIPLDIRPEHPK